MLRSVAAVALGATLSVALMPAQATPLMPAQATPYAGQFKYLTTGTVAVQGADGARWLLALTATSSGPVESRTQQRLYVDLSRCVGSACAAAGKWARPLTSAEVAITAATAVVDTQGTTATLRTVLGEFPLDVALEGGSVGGVAFHGVGLTTAPPGLAPSVSQYVFATGRVTLGGITCTVRREQAATVGRVTALDTVGDDARDARGAPPARLPSGFLQGKARPRCS